jgi:hypothetical protein
MKATNGRGGTGSRKWLRELVFNMVLCRLLCSKMMIIFDKNLLCNALGIMRRRSRRRGTKTTENVTLPDDLICFHAGNIERFNNLRQKESEKSFCLLWSGLSDSLDAEKAKSKVNFRFEKGEEVRSCDERCRFGCASDRKLSFRPLDGCADASELEQSDIG